MPDTLALDSCVRLDREGRAQNAEPVVGERVPAPNAGSWNAVKRVTGNGFSIEVPTVTVRDSTHGSYSITGFPGCRYFCSLDVALEIGAARETVDQYVARLRIIDTVNNPDAADWIPGPPRVVSVQGERGLMMETPCGDCTAGEIVIARETHVARISYNLDDREGDQPGLMCRLARTAASFRWQDQ
jgi:hypothetical protein